jgi:hypothetical protein
MEKRNRIKKAIESFGTLAVFSENEQPIRHIAEIIGGIAVNEISEVHDIIDTLFHELQYIKDEQIETRIWPIMIEFQYV